MDEFTHIVVIKFKIGQFEKVLNISEISGDQIIHGNHMKAFFDKSVA